MKKLLLKRDDRGGGNEPTGGNGRIEIEFMTGPPHPSSSLLDYAEGKV
jgi:hypothetical protein